MPHARCQFQIDYIKAATHAPTSAIGSPVVSAAGGSAGTPSGGSAPQHTATDGTASVDAGADSGGGGGGARREGLRRRWEAAEEAAESIRQVLDAQAHAMDRKACRAHRSTSPGRAACALAPSTADSSYAGSSHGASALPSRDASGVLTRPPVAEPPPRAASPPGNQPADRSVRCSLGLDSSRLVAAAPAADGGGGGGGGGSSAHASPDAPPSPAGSGASVVLPLDTFRLPAAAAQPAATAPEDGAWVSSSAAGADRSPTAPPATPAVTPPTPYCAPPTSVGAAAPPPVPIGATPRRPPPAEHDLVCGHVQEAELVWPSVARHAASAAAHDQIAPSQRRAGASAVGAAAGAVPGDTVQAGTAVGAVCPCGNLAGSTAGGTAGHGATRHASSCWRRHGDDVDAAASIADGGLSTTRFLAMSRVDPAVSDAPPEQPPAFRHRETKAPWWIRLGEHQKGAH